ncbi:MAG TPA: PIG-L family deacetylase [Methylibium sp.]|uniref:PIG-L deacetylase family protein n=1 Tax=Methylibium sp. TaxID=2067992 RepID=UPI002DBD0F41|nr:PIG-L family deacetylase [Methylibium sp.]HEU4457893.1 PIG-L family deacetylase [Methylibium sp.]
MPSNRVSTAEHPPMLHAAQGAPRAAGARRLSVFSSMKRTLSKLGVIEERRYAPAKGYLPDRSDLYEFDPRDSRSFPITIRDGTFEWPAAAAAGTSALLQLRLAGSSSLPFGLPWIDFAADGRAPLRQHFDRGAAGWRFLDLSALMRRGAPARVSLTTHRTAVDGEALLRVFDQPPVGARRVLVLGAHPDDAEIAAFGLYKNCTAAVVTLTAGDAGRPYYSHIVPDLRKQGELKTRLRVWDSLAVPLFGGVAPEHIANLGYFDGSLQPMRQNPSMTCSSKSTGRSDMNGQRRAFAPKLLRDGAAPHWESLVLDLVHVLDAFAPDIVVTPHPFLDAHSDHRFGSIALFEALQRRGGGSAGGELWLYSNHPPYCGSWPFGPPGSPSSLAPWPRVPAKLRGFHSHPLSLDDQIDKLFALESMHDLRRPPPSITRKSEWGAWSHLWEARDALLRSRAGQGTFSYMRRSVRSDEIFFVHPMTDAAALIEAHPDARQQW